MCQFCKYSEKRCSSLNESAIHLQAPVDSALAFWVANYHGLRPDNLVSAYSAEQHQQHLGGVFAFLAGNNKNEIVGKGGCRKKSDGQCLELLEMVGSNKN